MLNSSGYSFKTSADGDPIALPSFRGEFHDIGAIYNTSDNQGTWGASDQTIRMLYQDYIGTYVFHCHILPHEDAGMMQVITIVENTDSSWLVPAESDNYVSKDNSITLRLAQNFEEYSLSPSGNGGSVQRIQAGDLNHDFSQDIAISRAGINGESGVVELYDGASLQNRTTEQLSSLKAYPESNLAPWAFIEDFTGDGKRDLVTAGFKENTANLSDLQIKAWTSKRNGTNWNQAFEFYPLITSIPICTPMMVIRCRKAI